MIELMVVIIIIAIVATIGANNFGTQRSYVRYNDSVLHVVQMIKTARNYAVTSRSYWDDNLQENVVPPEGYGIFIDRNVPGQSRVILFVNTDDPTDPVEERDQYEPLEDIIEEEYILPIDNEFVGLSVDQALPNHTPINGLTTDDEAVIIFRPPLADVTIAANDNVGPLVYLDDLFLEFKRGDSPPGIPSNYIHFNHIAGFPELSKE